MHATELHEIENTEKERLYIVSTKMKNEIVYAIHSFNENGHGLEGNVTNTSSITNKCFLPKIMTSDKSLKINYHILLNAIQIQ